MKNFLRITKTIAVSALLGFCLPLPHALGASSSPIGTISVLDYGADPGGGQDSTGAFQSAASEAANQSAVLTVPGGTYLISSPVEINSSVSMASNATLKAVTSMSAVIKVGSSAIVKNTSFSGGRIDANNLAYVGVMFRRYNHIRVENTGASNALNYGFQFGDASLTDPSYEAMVSGIFTQRDAGSLQGGSSALFVDSNAMDNSFVQCVLSGFDIGIKVLTGGNFFTDVHAWSTPSAGWMSVSFDDYGTGNFWKGCESDTASRYGLHAHAFNTSVDGCRFYNNLDYGQDNAVTGIYFDNDSPGSTVANTLFFGGNSSHRLMADISGASAGVTLSGNQSVNVSNVFTVRSTVNGKMYVNGSFTSSGAMYGQSFSTVAPTASSSQQNTSTSMSLGSAWYSPSNGSSNNYAWTLAPGTSSQTSADLFLFTKGTLPGDANPRLVLGVRSATGSSPQVASTQQVFQASYLNNGKAAYDNWGVQSTITSGGSPNSTLAFTHWGSGGAAAVSVPNLVLHGETMSASPRLTWTPFGNCPTTTAGCQESSLWAPSRGIVITQWSFSLVTPPQACSGYPTLSLMQGRKVLASTALRSGTMNYKVDSDLSVPVNSSDGSLSIQVTSGGSGCQVDAAGVSSTVEYIMQ